VDRNEPQCKSDKLRFEEAISIHLQLKGQVQHSRRRTRSVFEAWFVPAGNEWKRTPTACSDIQDAVVTP